MANFEKYLYRTVRVNYRNKLNKKCSQVGIIQGITAKKLVFLALDDDEDCEILIELDKIDKIKEPE